MQFLLIFKPKSELAEDALRPIIKKENVEAWKMVTEGILRSLWYLPPPSAEAKSPGGSVCIFECADEAEVRKQIDRLPLVKNGFVSVELLQLNPFKGFELLFATSDGSWEPAT